MLAWDYLAFARRRNSGCAGDGGGGGDDGKAKKGTNTKEKKKVASLESLDDDPMAPFRLHASSASVCVKEIIALCTCTLDEAVDTDNGDLDALLPALYRASQEVLDLFRAIVRARHRRKIAAMMHNDTRVVSFLGVYVAVVEASRSREGVALIA